MAEDITSSFHAWAPRADSSRTFQESAPLSSVALRRWSIHQTTTFRWSLEEDVAHYQQAGFSVMGLWRRKLEEFGVERGIDLIQESGLRVSSLSWAGGFTGSNGFGFDEAINDAREAIQMAAALNAESLVISSGPRSGHIHKHARRLLYDALDVLVDEAASANVVLALQPMHQRFSKQWTYLNSISETLSILEYYSSSNLRMALDASHFWQTAEFREYLATWAHWLSVVQVNDYAGDVCMPYGNCLPGDGVVPVRAIVESVLAAGYQGCFELGLWSHDVWQRDYIQLLESCRSRCRGLTLCQAAY